MYNKGCMRVSCRLTGVLCLFILSWVTSILGVTSFILSPSVDSIPVFFNGTACGSFVYPPS